MSKEKLIQGLNDDLAAEWGTVIRYMYRAGKSFGMLSVELKEMFGEKIQEELGYAAFLTDVIIDLGRATTTTSKEFAEPKGLKVMLELDFEIEQHDVESYIKYAQMDSDLSLKMAVGKAA